eukprot:14805768-Heterocapsa_arctica.AAC.1
MQTSNYDSDDELNKNTMILFWCNLNKWGAQDNNYDLLFPIEEKMKKEKSFKYKLIEKHDAFNIGCNMEDKLISNYISRRSTDEVER